MKYLQYVSDFIEKYLGVKNEYALLILLTALIIFISRVIIHVVCNIYNYFNKNAKSRYIYNRKIHILGNILTTIIIFFLLEDYLNNIVTIVSFVSAAMTIALKEVIVNFFAGIYIKIKKPFEVEDRIEINGLEGDVVNINVMNFEILEVSTKDSGSQSTGVITHFPNSVIFSSPLKNYVKAFKYVWDEITIKINLNSNLRKTKGIIYKIVNQNDVIKSIPIKMQNQINNASSEYRIYYNKMEPIIYTKIVNNHIELSVRYLMHPKKIRNVQNDIYEKIYDEYRKGEISLYEDNN